VSALGAGLICWFILYSYDLTSNVFHQLNIFLRIAVSLVLCIFSYLAVVVVLYKGVKPITQFVSVLREMIPKFSLCK
jgi:hypothetical protein